MRAVIQRVTNAQVSIDGTVTAKIGNGLCILLGIHHSDGPNETDAMLNKLLKLRLFNTADKGFEHSIQDIDGEILVVSQFTLYANCDKGRRPSFTDAAPPDTAKSIYNDFCTKLKTHHPKTKTGTFAATMQITLTNNGPVTLTIET